MDTKIIRPIFLDHGTDICEAWRVSIGNEHTFNSYPTTKASRRRLERISRNTHKYTTLIVAVSDAMITIAIHPK